MVDSRFIDALREITAGKATLADVIDAAAGLGGEGRADLAIELYRVWAEFNREHPQLFVAHFNAASLQTALGDQVGAEQSLRRALALNPDFYPAYINIGGVLERQGQLDAALEQWMQVVNRLNAITGAATAFKLTALQQISRVLLDHQRGPAAEATLRQGLEIRSDQREVLEQYFALRLGKAEWPVITPWEGADRSTLVGGASPLSLGAYTDDPLLHLAAASHYVAVAVVDDPSDGASDRRDASTDIAGRRLRIGYVSSDLRDHAIGYLMAELFELHDQNAVEVFAYYCGPDPTGALNDRVRAEVEHWIDINAMDDAAAAARVAADQIDVLVDVNGLTKFARTGVFARRPAPIQVNWLGFPGSMGSPYHQYLIADAWIIPPESERFYSERVLRLACYQSNDRRRAVSPDRPSRGPLGLPEDAFVFCCFNGGHKITRFTFDRWMTILLRTPASVLWLLDPGVEIAERLHAYAEWAGVARERLVFAPKLANAFHLARYPAADLFLDTSPYGAHTTASDALWMGVPVLTLSGRSFAARVCGSLVRAAGLPELICDDADAYVERATSLAADPVEMARLRTRLEDGRNTCELFDMNRLTRDLEDLYRQMCEEHDAEATARPDLRNLDVYRDIGLAFDHETTEMRGVADYEALYLDKLRQRHRVRPIPPDGRLWTEAEIARLDGGRRAADPAV